MKPKSKNKQIFIKCSCYGHAIEFVYEPEDKMMDIALWERGIQGRPLSWKERFRWIWHILTTGNVWTDSVVLFEEDIKKLQKFINKLN